MNIVKPLLILAVLSLFILFSSSPCFSETAIGDEKSTIENFDDSADADFSDDDFSDDDFSDDDFSDDDFAESDEDSGSEELETEDVSSAKSFLSTKINMKGHLKLSSAVNTAHNKPDSGQMDWRGLSKLKSELFLELNAALYKSWKLSVSGNGFYDASYSINDRDDATDDVIDNYESGGELKKAWIEGSITDWFDIKAGRQVVVWGKSDSIRVTDILNPLNLQDPKPSNMNDLDNLRLPVAMTKLDFFRGDWNLTAIAIHEHRFNQTPEFGSDFYPAPTQPPPSEEIPGNHISNTEYAASLSGTFSGWDMKFYFANVYNNFSHIVIKSWDSIAQEHARIKMAGADLNLAFGNWLVKSEAAYFTGIRLNDTLSGTTIINLSQNNHSRLNTLAGIEYSGFSDTTLMLEVMNEHLKDLGLIEKNTGHKENSLQSSIRLSRNFFNERLEIILMGAVYGEKGKDGSMYRFASEYELTDSIILNGGFILYEGGDNPILERFKDNDKIVFDIKFSF